MYSILLDDNKSIKRAKGEMKCVLKKEILQHFFKEVLSKMYSILLDNNNIYKKSKGCKKACIIKEGNYTHKL